MLTNLVHSFLSNLVRSHAKIFLTSENATRLISEKHKKVATLITENKPSEKTFNLSLQKIYDHLCVHH